MATASVLFRKLIKQMSISERTSTDSIDVTDRQDATDRPAHNRTSSSSLVGNRLSVSSRVPNVRKMSRLELVGGPDGATLVEVEEYAHSVVRDSMSIAATIGGIATQLDKQEIDKKIQTEVAHHSPAVEDGTSTSPDESNPNNQAIGVKWLRFILDHMHAALASPLVFRLPYLVQKHSTDNGSAFLFVYVLLLLLVGTPLYFLECTMAQYSSLGPIYIYRCLPLFTGVGTGMLLMCFLLMCYSSVVVAWTLIYVMQGFYSPLPWENCPSGSAPVCTNISKPLNVNSSLLNQDYVSFGLFETNNLNTSNTTGDQRISFQEMVPSEYFFQNRVTHTLFNEDRAIWNLEEPMWLLAVWVFVFFNLARRRKWNTGLFSWIMCFLMTVMLFSYFIIGLELEEGDRGIHRAFALNFTYVNEDILNPTIWLDALGQVFWSLGIAIGLLIMKTSHNRFNESIVRQTTAAVLCNLLLSVLVVLAVFPFMGQLSFSPALPANPGFFFVVMSYAATEASVPQLASFMLFAPFCLLLISHVVNLADTVLGSLTEIVQLRWRRGFRRISVGAAICLVSLGVSTLFVSSDVVYYLTTMDSYLPWVTGSVFASLELIAFVHVYGVKNIKQHLNKMNRTGTIFVQYWKFVLPPILIAIQLWGWIVGVDEAINWNHDLTNREEKQNTVGLFLAILPILGLMSGTFTTVYIYRMKNKTSLIKPQPTWGPALQQHRKMYSSDLLKATRRIPWLVMQSDGDLVAESGHPDWIPIGYTFLPEDSSVVLLSSAVMDDMNDTGRMTVIENFLQKFGADESCRDNGQKKLAICDKCRDAISVRDEHGNMRKLGTCQFNYHVHNDSFRTEKSISVSTNTAVGKDSINSPPSDYLNTTSLVPGNVGTTRRVTRERSYSNARPYLEAASIAGSVPNQPTATTIAQLNDVAYNSNPKTTSSAGGDAWQKSAAASSIARAQQNELLLRPSRLQTSAFEIKNVSNFNDR